MNHIHHDHALAMLHALPFTTEETALMEAAAAALDWEQLSPMIEQLQHPATAEAAKNAAYELIAEQDRTHHGIAGMCVFAAGMYGTAKRLYAQGISKQVLLDTFCCLHRMAGEYRREFGYFGFDRGFWVWRQTCGTLVRLGTLEFEYLPALSEWAAGITGLQAGLPVLSVHIPSAADLSREALDDSYQQARTFYREHPCMCLKDGQVPQGIICNSWLLSPTLRTLLKPNSGIRRFAEDFQLCHSEAESKGCWHFLFMAKDDVAPADLPENTSLQRSVKAHLMAGGGIGGGFGLLKR